MKWNEYVTYYQHHRKLHGYLCSMTEHADICCEDAANNPNDVDKLDMANAVQLERNWCNLNRPFYNVWPCIAEALIKTSLDIPNVILFSMLQKLPELICCRFATGHEELLIQNKKFETCKVESILYAPAALADVDSHDRFTVALAHTDRLRYNHLVCRFDTEPDTLVSNYLGNYVGIERYLGVFRLLAAIAIIAADAESDLISPVVMRKHQEKYELSGNSDYIERARRNGLVGWNIGSNIEVSAHVRRPHFGLRWTGKGSEIPKIVPIKGTVVKRNKMMEVPTGYLGPMKEDNYV